LHLRGMALLGCGWDNGSADYTDCSNHDERNLHRHLAQSVYSALICGPFIIY
jgi:hypothetical protein